MITRDDLGRPVVLAHRGASRHAPENTVAAFRLAAEHGADGIEVDLRFSNDGAVVLHHDPEIEGLGPIAHHTLVEALDAQPDLATLQQTLLLDDSLILNVEIKNDPREPGFDPQERMATHVVAWIRDNGLHDRVLVTSFSMAALDRVRFLDSSIPTGVLLNHFDGLRKAVRTTVGAGHSWILPTRARLLWRPRSAIETAHRAGLKVGAWTVDRPRRLVALAEAGIDAVITNDPRRALEAYSS